VTLAAARTRLEVEFSDFAPGTPQAPQEGSADWFYLRALGLALSTLRRAESLAVADPTSFERFLRSAANNVKATLPEEIAV
jgi:hypothetical protein